MNRLRPSGLGASVRPPYGLGDGARMRRDRSMVADAQRRYNAAAHSDEALTPEVSDRSSRPGWRGRPAGEVELTLLTHQARALYEARVMPVRALARLCGVSLRTLYYHVHKQGWRRRRSSVPRDLAKSERQKQRYRELKAQRPVAPRGLKARDPDGQARALAFAERAGALSAAALSRALMRQDAEARARILSIMTRALRDLAIANGAKTRRARTEKQDKPRRRPYQWRPMGTPPAWAERKR